VSGGSAWWAARKKAIQSFRLRLRSGLRQSGRRLCLAGYPGLRPRLVYVGPLALGFGVVVASRVWVGLWAVWRRAIQAFCRVEPTCPQVRGRMERPATS